MDLSSSSIQDMIHRFDGFEVDEALFELRLNGAKLDLQRRAFDLLVHLVRHRDRVVTTRELLASVWNGTIVSENAIAQAVTTLRKRLARFGGPHAIRTARGRGYRFVREVLATTARSATTTRPAAPTPVPAPATLPSATVIVMGGELPQCTLDAVLSLLRECTGREPWVARLDEDHAPGEIGANRPGISIDDGGANGRWRESVPKRVP